MSRAAAGVSHFNGDMKAQSQDCEREPLSTITMACCCLACIMTEHYLKLYEQKLQICFSQNSSASKYKAQIFLLQYCVSKCQ